MQGELPLRVQAHVRLQLRTAAAGTAPAAGTEMPAAAPWAAPAPACVPPHALPRAFACLHPCAALEQTASPSLTRLVLCSCSTVSPSSSCDCCYRKIAKDQYDAWCKTWEFKRQCLLKNDGGNTDPPVIDPPVIDPPIIDPPVIIQPPVIVQPPTPSP